MEINENYEDVECRSRFARLENVFVSNLLQDLTRSRHETRPTPARIELHQPLLKLARMCDARAELPLLKHTRHPTQFTRLLRHAEWLSYDVLMTCTHLHPLARVGLA